MVKTPILGKKDDLFLFMLELYPSCFGKIFLLFVCETRHYFNLCPVFVRDFFENLRSYIERIHRKDQSMYGIKLH